MALLMAVATGGYPAHAAVWSKAGAEIGRHVEAAAAAPVVRVAASVPTRGEKKILSKIKRHARDMKSLAAKMRSTTKRLKSINAKMKR